MQFSTIYTRVEDITNVKSKRAMIKDAIQRGLDMATSAELPYLMEETFITTIAPHTTGNVDVTNASKTVSGGATSPVFTAAMVGRKIRVAGETAYYRIAAFVSSTEITLQVPYQGDTDTDQEYSLYQDEYRLPADLDTYKIMRQIENGIALISAESTVFDILQPSPQSEGKPAVDILSGSKLDTYSTGTVAISANTSVITGSSSVWTDVQGLGRGSRITVSSIVYTVKSVDSDTQITIYETVSAAVSAGTSYSVSLDNLIIQFFQIPDAADNIYFRYQRIPFPLVGDSDVPDLPEKYHHILVTAGLIWAWMTKDKEEALRQEALFNAQVKTMWARIGHISSGRTYPRFSQDDIFFSNFLGKPRYPNNIGLPESIR